MNNDTARIEELYLEFQGICSYAHFNDCFTCNTVGCYYCDECNSVAEFPNVCKCNHIDFVHSAKEIGSDTYSCEMCKCKDFVLDKSNTVTMLILEYSK